MSASGGSNTAYTCVTHDECWFACFIPCHILHTHFRAPPPTHTHILDRPNRYTPDANGFFAGQTGYGYISISAFIAAAAAVNSGSKGLTYFEQEGQLALASKTLAVTAILQVRMFVSGYNCSRCCRAPAQTHLVPVL